MGERAHIPVLLAPVVAMLVPALVRAQAARGRAVLLDCTAGLGGHAAAIVGAWASAQPGLAPAGDVVLMDLDPGNLARAQAHVRQGQGATAGDGGDGGGGGGGLRVHSVRANFAEAPYRLAELSLAGDAVLADLGFASTQVDDPARGLSFMRDGPLDMRLDPAGPLSAAQFVAQAPEDELARVIRDFGEERFAWRVAKRIVEARREAPITTTAQLADLVRSVVPRDRSAARPIDPATRTFQALRIAVNDELGNLQALMDAVVRSGVGGGGGVRVPWLNPGARVAVISFHSLEDRPVKRAFGEMVERGRGVELTRKPIEAEEDETRMNPRSRSAKLRGVELPGA
jgi:16S rRNA (cytosine1402-N4)-methyltransferase